MKHDLAILVMQCYQIITISYCHTILPHRIAIPYCPHVIMTLKWLDVTLLCSVVAFEMGPVSCDVRQWLLCVVLRVIASTWYGEDSGRRAGGDLYLWMCVTGQVLQAYQPSVYCRYLVPSLLFVAGSQHKMQIFLFVCFKIVFPKFFFFFFLIIYYFNIFWGVPVCLLLFCFFKKKKILFKIIVYYPSSSYLFVPKFLKVSDVKYIWILCDVLFVLSYLKIEQTKNPKQTNKKPNTLYFPHVTSYRHSAVMELRERYVLFNDALNTSYLRLYGVRHMVKDHSDSEKGNPLLPHRLLLSISSKGSFICTIPQTG